MTIQILNNIINLWNQSYNKNYPPPRSLPFISEETRQRLLEELGLQTPPTTLRVFEGITNEKQLTPSELVYGMTQNIFVDIIDVNRPLAEEINKSTTGVTPVIIDARMAGMALVIRVYDLELEHDFIHRFVNLDAEDLGIVSETVKAGNWNQSILHKLLTTPRIPEQQVALNSIVREASRDVMMPGEFIIGAGQMYALLLKWWPKMFPNQTSDQPPTADLA